MTKTCKQCGKEFVSPYTGKLAINQKYCSRKCCVDSRRVVKVVNVCEQCGKEYEVYPRNQKKRRACSVKCQHILLRKGKNVSCGYCGKAIYRKRGKLFRNKKSFCSKKCRNLAIRTGGEVECQYCGILIFRTQSRLDNNKRQFCNEYCRNLYFQGINHQSYIHGLCNTKEYIKKKRRKYYVKHYKGVYRKKLLIKMKKWRDSNPDRYRKQRCIAFQKSKDALSDAYVKARICFKTDLKHADIPDELVAYKREQLKTYRFIREFERKYLCQI